jgi:aldose 1-epimerase
MKIEIVKHVKNIDEIIITSPMQQVISLLNIGADIYKWITPLKKEIVARYLNIEDYLTNEMSFGATVGMNSGRIENSMFELDGIHYHFKGENPHFLHGGDEHLYSRFFEYTIKNVNENMAEVVFTHQYTHPVLPGVQNIEVIYQIFEGKVTINYFVKSNVMMLCNLTNHSYFNLDGDFTRPIDSHELRVPSSQVVLVDEEFLGREILNVEGTEFDFRKRKPILPVVEVLKTKYPVVKGLDHFFLLDEPTIELYSSKSKTSLKVITSYPGVTIYSTNYPNEQKTQTSKPLDLHYSLCIEPQFQSNAINDRRFEVGLVYPSKTYHHMIEYVLEEKNI